MKKSATLSSKLTGAISLTSVLSVGFVLFVVLPIVVTVAVALSENSARGIGGDGFTFRWISDAASQIGSTLQRSMGFAFGVVLANLLLGGPLAMWLARSNSWATKMVSFLATLPLAVPGIALSIGLITMYPELRPSGILLFCGHVVLTLPFLVAALTPVFSSAELQDCENVAESLGASVLRIITTVTIPYSSAAILQAGITVFALSFGEFNISFFINPPASPMAPFALFDAYSTQRLELASAKTVLFMLCVLPVMLGAVALRRRLTQRKVNS